MTYRTAEDVWHIEVAKTINCKQSMKMNTYNFVLDIEDLMNLARKDIAEKYGLHPNHVQVRALDDGFEYVVDLAKVKK